MRKRKQKKRLGVAAVEFAIVAPLFFMLILGFIELGRAFMVQQILTNASRVGARQAITLNGTESDVVSVTESYMSGMGITGVTVSVIPSPASAQAGDAMTVTVEIPFGDVSWLPSPEFLAGKTLTASSVMRKEGFE